MGAVLYHIIKLSRFEQSSSLKWLDIGQRARKGAYLEHSGSAPVAPGGFWKGDDQRSRQRLTTDGIFASAFTLWLQGMGLELLEI